MEKQVESARQIANVIVNNNVKINYALKAILNEIK
jgi:hypothetical protein